jgi:hypothetical protein
MHTGSAEPLGQVIRILEKEFYKTQICSEIQLHFWRKDNI